MIPDITLFNSTSLQPSLKNHSLWDKLTASPGEDSTGLYAGV